MDHEPTLLHGPGVPGPIAWLDHHAGKLRQWWRTHHKSILWLAIGAMAAVAAWRMGQSLPRLLWESSSPGAMDIMYRREEMQLWFAGSAVYDVVPRAPYPPASYLMMWPFMGWSSFAVARWLWAITAIVSLVCLGLLGIRGSQSSGWSQRLFVALLPFALYPAGMVIMVGQLSIHVAALLVSGLVILRHSRGRWWMDVCGAMAVLLALVKPPVSAPFFWMVAFCLPSLRAAALIVFGYLAMTWAAITFQEVPLADLLRTYFGQHTQTALTEGAVNLHGVLDSLGLGGWMMPASLLVLSGFGAWMFFLRRADYWVLIGVTALVSRLWIYRRRYDDLLILLSMIALLRVMRQRRVTPNSDVLAGVLFAANWVTMMAPSRPFPQPWNTIRESVLATLWLATLAFLMAQAHRRTRIAPAVEEGLSSFDSARQPLVESPRRRPRRREAGS